MKPHEYNLLLNQNREALRDALEKAARKEYNYITKKHKLRADAQMLGILDHITIITAWAARIAQELYNNQEEAVTDIYKAVMAGLNQSDKVECTKHPMGKNKELN